MVTGRGLALSQWAFPLAVPVAVGAIVVINAWPGLMPVVGFWDTGEFQTVLPILGTAHPTGYPTYVLLGFVGNLLLTPIGPPAFRVTVLSLLAVAVAAGLTVALVRRLTGSTIVGAAAGLGLATTPVVWLNATRADPHPVHLAFVALLAIALVRWEHGRREVGASAADRRLVLAAALFGLAAGNHSLTLLLGLPIALYVLAVEPTIRRRPRLVGACVGVAALAMALVYLELPIRAGVLRAPLVYGRPDTWDGFWYVALAAQFQGSLGDVFANLPGKVEHVAGLAIDQLGLLAALLPVAFLATIARAPRYALLSGGAVLVTLVFNASYANADIERYYLGPVFWAWTWLAVLAAELARLAAGALAAPVERPRTQAAIAIVLAALLLAPAGADLDARRHAADRSHVEGAALWLDEVLPRLAPDAVVVSWWSTSTPLWYAKHVEGRRPDVDIVDDRTMLDLELGRAPDVIRRYLGSRPVYAIRANDRDLRELTDQFVMEQIAGNGSSAVYLVSGVRTQGG